MLYDNCPEFALTEYHMTINENLPFNQSIVHVTATGGMWRMMKRGYTQFGKEKKERLLQSIDMVC